MGAGVRRHRKLGPLVEIAREASVTGHIPAPKLTVGGRMPVADRWRQAELALERAAEVPGPYYQLPNLPSGPQYSIQSGYTKEVAKSSAFDGNGGGPGVCRFDSAFGKQVLSSQVSAPFAVFDSRDTSQSFAPVLKLRGIQAADDTHDHPAEPSAGMRETVTGAASLRGLPGVGTYMTNSLDMAQRSAARFDPHAQALHHARASFAARTYS